MSPFDLLFKKKKKRKCLLGKRQGEEGVLKDDARLLKEVISFCGGRDCYPVQMFSAKEIEQAIKKPWPYLSSPQKYFGIYQDRPIFIRPYNLREYAFNEIVVLSQIKHTNVVKLIGCCFEMEQPISILEYVPYSLYNHLFETNNPSSLSPISWDHRLRIAIEIAYAVTYLHIGTSRPIVHRDIKCSNILLDEHFKPKLADFSVSVTIPVGETHVKRELEGTIGYLDPACFATRFVSEKTDVYSYGVVLFELLSGRKMSTLIGPDFWHDIDKEITDKEKGLKFILGNGLSMNVNQVEQAIACMELASRCITLNLDERPSMKDVTKQLWQIERAEFPPPSFSSS